MRQEHDDLLVEKYPLIFAKRHLPMCVGDGWFQLIDTLCRALQGTVDRTRPPHPQVVATQVKEKFGGLRFYVNGVDDYQRGMIDMAEEMSYHLCEECGASGQSFVTQSEWHTTRCERHVPAGAVSVREWALRALRTWDRRRTNVEILWHGHRIPVWDVDGKEEAVFYPEMPERLAESFAAYVERNQFDDKPCLWAARAQHLRDFIAEAVMALGREET